jgi:outer membrane protein assembly factor BamB
MSRLLAVLACAASFGCRTSEAPASQAPDMVSIVVLPNSVAIQASKQTVHAVGPDGTQRWKMPIPDGDKVAAPLTGALNSTVYVRGERGLYAASPEGKWLWKRDLAGKGPAGPIYGPIALPDSSVAVLVGARQLLGFEHDGTPRWDVQLPEGDVTAAPATAANGHVLVATTAGIYSISPGGEIVWRFKP